MKRLLVISDVHGDAAMVKKVLDSVEYDYVAFAGDWVIDNEQLKNRIDFFIIGNNDWRMKNEQSELLFKIEDVKIFLTHGHFYPRHFGGINEDRLCEKAKSLGAELVIFGHSHVKKNIMIDDIMLFNPGSLVEPRDDSNGSYGIIEIDGSKIISAEHHYLKYIY